MKNVICLIIILLCVIAYKNYIRNYKLYFEKIKTTKTTEQDCRRLAQKFNEGAKNIQNFFLPQTTIKFRKKNISVRLNCVVAFEKEKRFRLIVENFLKIKELDLGSNSSVFWYWSKQMRPSNLCFSSHENINKANLKAEFDPTWMMECMNLKEIDEKKCLFSQNTITQKLNNGSMIIVFDSNEKKIKSKFLYDAYGFLVANVEYNEYVDGFPRIINLNWLREDTSIQFDLHEAVLNAKIPDNYWKMPNTYPQINIGE